MLAALFSIGSALMQMRAGSKAKKGGMMYATRIEETGKKQAGLLTDYAVEQEKYATRYDVYSQGAEDAMIKNTQLKYIYAGKQADLEEKEIPLLELSIKRQVEDEKTTAIDREIGRRRRLNKALASQAALRTASGIQAYDGSPLAMMGADIAEFDYDQARDKADTARRIVDANFFGAERAKLMKDRVSLLRYGAETEYSANLDQAALVKEQIGLQADSIRMAAKGTRMSAESKLEASKLEAEAARIQAGQTKTAAGISAANTLLNAAYRYQQLGD